jgi:hypothetical protein
LSRFSPPKICFPSHLNMLLCATDGANRLFILPPNPSKSIFSHIISLLNSPLHISFSKLLLKLLHNISESLFLIITSIFCLSLSVHLIFSLTQKLSLHPPFSQISITPNPSNSTLILPI